MTSATAHRLTFGIDGQKGVALSPLTGAAERAAAGDAQALLRALLSVPAGPAETDPHPPVAPADRLTVGDRDRLLAQIYGDLYGWDILADARCGGCQARFELRFSLRDLIRARAPDGSAPDGVVSIGDARLRLPLVTDRAPSARALVDRLTVDGTPPPLEQAEAALEAADPALELDLNGTCPECDTPQAVPFSMTGFLGAALARDHRFLLREVHLLARSYGWSLDSILSLTRTERQEFVRLILAEQGAGEPGIRRVS